MIVDLNTLHYRQARELILWCVANDIDKERANELYFSWYEPAGSKKEYIWELDIPEEYMSFVVMKWLS